MVRQLGERLAMNTPIQGSAADIIKVAMIKVYNRLKEEYPDTKLLLQVHDELILQAPITAKDTIKNVLVESMEEAFKLEVKLVAEVNEGANWFDLK
jgi:DNA polymerase-1